MTTDAAVRKIEKAQEVAQSGVVSYLLDQADALLDAMVGEYHARRLTDRDAAIGIATIANLRRAADRGTREVMRGTEAGEQLTRSTR